MCKEELTMNRNQYYDRWSSVDWSDDHQHFAEKIFIELVEEYRPDFLEKLEPQVPIEFNNTTGYIDFVLDEKYPIEIDGESYHAEGRVRASRFDDLTSKQNETVGKYGNITRITYKMLKEKPRSAMNLLSKNLANFSKQEKELNEILEQISNAKMRTRRIQQEFVNREKRFGSELQDKLHELEESGRMLQDDIKNKMGTLASLQEEANRWTKRIITIIVCAALLVIAIIVGVNINAENKKKVEEEQLAAERTAKIIGGETCMSVSEVNQYVGKSGVCVSYYVSQVSENSYFVYLNDKPYPNSTFTALVKSKKIISKDEAKTNYLNKNIEVHGDIIKYNSTYEIEVYRADQIKVKE
jgi:hypothetical protein